MDPTSLVTALVTSASVSGLALVILKAYLKERVSTEFKMQLEIMKADLARSAELRHGVEKWRHDVYPVVVESAYRTRNIAREIAESSAKLDFALLDALRERGRDLEDVLYRTRIYLEADGLFSIAHTYKNAVLRNFMILAEDAKHYAQKSEDAKLDDTIQRLVAEFERIDLLFAEITTRFSFRDRAEQVDVEANHLIRKSS